MTDFDAPVLPFNSDTDDDDVIVIESKARRRFKVDLAGQRYTVRAIKTAATFHLATLGSAKSDSPEAAAQYAKALGRLLNTMFGDQAEAVEARLNDPADDLDWPEVMELVNKVLERQTDLPTM